MTKINFTAEHKAKLDQALLAFLYAGGQITGSVGTTVNAYQLLHNTSVKTLQQMYISLQREIENTAKLDEWSMTDYQQSQLKSKKETAEMIHLLIGYKKYLSEKESNAENLKMKKAELQRLKEEKKTPEERIAELEKEILAAENY